MTHIGCLFVAFLLSSLCALGTSTALRHDRSAWLGLALGVIAWLAVMGGYTAWLSIYDWSNRHKYRVGVPWWVIPLVWIFFIGTATATVTLYAHIARGS